MGDFLKPLSTEENIKNLVMSLINSLGICGFRLTNWLSNSHNVLRSLPTSELSPKIGNLALSSYTIERALGMYWDIEHDNFVIKPIEKDMPVPNEKFLVLFHLFSTHWVY